MTSAITTGRRATDRYLQELPVRVCNHQAPGWSAKFTNDEEVSKEKEESIPLVSVEINREFQVPENIISDHVGLTSKPTDVNVTSRDKIGCTDENTDEWKDENSSTDNLDQCSEMFTTKDCKERPMWPVEINDKYLVDVEIVEEL